MTQLWEIISIMQSKKITIIDDDQSFADQCSEMLSISGYQTRSFYDGDTALRAIQKDQPDLILLDLKMDGKNGFEVAELLHQDEKTSDIPIIIISAFYQGDSSEMLQKDLGVKSCLSKPIRPQGLLAEVESIIKND
jgi:DNA-binding response OmpR family regulator